MELLAWFSLVVFIMSMVINFINNCIKDESPLVVVIGLILQICILICLYNYLMLVN